ncbi:glycosyltransferase [Microbacterium proteolyticum]|uniref:glycosyltransferase n=1 Tax=Microbacterium proteolyticum TaxID=1572644 RepID=UPI00358E72BC
MRTTSPSDVPRRASAWAWTATAPVIVSVGQIRRYKNVPHLIRTFREAGIDATLLIAGKPSPTDLEDEIREAARGDERVVFDARFLPDDDIVAALAAADLVVLPYAKIENSGSAVLAVSADRPVLVPRLGAMSELQEQVGEEWVRLYDGELTTAALTDALAWAREADRPPRADLAALDWDAIAEETLKVYQRVQVSSRS